MSSKNRGWALWKALVTLAHALKINSADAARSGRSHLARRFMNVSPRVAHVDTDHAGYPAAADATPRRPASVSGPRIPPGTLADCSLRDSGSCWGWPFLLALFRRLLSSGGGTAPLWTTSVP